MIVESKKLKTKENEKEKPVKEVKPNTLTIKARKIEGVEKIQEVKSKSKDDGSRLAQLKKKREEKIKRKIYKSGIPDYESYSEDVNEVALRLAETFPYSEIAVAWDERQAPHIHGWIQDHYRNFQWLIDNYVLEVSAWYARNKLEHKIDIVKIIEGVPIKDYKTARVELSKIHRLDNYPNQPFINVLMLAEEHIDDAIYWLQDSEWYIDGEDVRVNIGRIGAELIAWLSWNVPVFLITHLPFRNKGIYKAKAEAKDILDVAVDQRLKLIHTYRTMIDTLDAKIDEKAREAKQWHKMYSDLKKEYDLEYRRQLARMEYMHRKGSSGKPPVNMNISLLVLLVVVAVLALVGWVV